MIILKTLKWDNCFSYGEGNILELNQNNVTQLIGENGSGKSSIPLILQEVLFNKNSKGVKKTDIPRRGGNGKYFIELDFQRGDTEYKVVVNRAASVKVKLFENEEDISSHTATGTFKQLEDIIGLDFKTFSQLVYQDTSSSLDFLTATDASRKKFLVDLFNLDEYTKFFNIFKEALRVENSALTSQQGKIAGLEKWLHENEKADTTPQQVPKIEKLSESDQEELANLKTEFKNISETNSKIARNNHLIEQVEELSKTISIGETLPTPIATGHLTEEKYLLQGELKVVNEELRKLAKLADFCPSCLQEVSPELKAEMETQKVDAGLVIRTRIDELDIELANAEKINRNISARKKLKDNLEQTLKRVNKTMPRTLLDEEDLESKINELTGKIRSQRTSIRAQEEQRDHALQHNARIKIIEEQLVKAKEEISEVSERAQELQEIVANLEILKKAFGTSGLVAYKLENLVQDLETITNTYLAMLSDGRFTINFIAENDKLNVEITDNGDIVSMQALSSGEQARVCTGTLLAMRKLMTSIANTKINTLFLDEVISVLDVYGKENLMEILMNETELNTYVVSHGWTGNPLLSKIEVAKVDNISALDNSKNYGKSTNERS